MLKDEMLEHFEVLGFGYGYCIVRRKSDGVKGTLDFIDDLARGREYFNFQEA
jgi:hypothetical protein